MRDCTAISKKHTTASVCSFPVSEPKTERILLFSSPVTFFFLSRAMRSITPSGLVAHGWILFSSDFLTNEFRQTPDSERSMRRNLNTQPTLNDGVNSVWAQQMDFKHQIFFVNWSCVNSVWSHFGHRCNRRPQQQNNRLAVNEKSSGRDTISI